MTAHNSAAQGIARVQQSRQDDGTAGPGDVPLTPPASPHDRIVDTFATFFPPNMFRHGRLHGIDPQTGKKRVSTTNGPVTRQSLASHLGANGRVAGHALGYLPGDETSTPVGAIDLDGKDISSDELERRHQALLRVCRELSLSAYAESSISGQGWHLWLWSTEPLAYAVMRNALRTITRRAGLGQVETYPMGKDALGRWIITPYARALYGSAPHLGTTYLLSDDGQPIPVDELVDWITLNPAERLRQLAEEEAQQGGGASVTLDVDDEAADLLPEAVPMLLAAAAQHAPSNRHDTVVAFLNLAHRAGALDEMVDGLSAPAILTTWCPDGSRTPQGWSAEINRWAQTVTTSTTAHRRGIRYLRDAGFDIPELPKRKQSRELPQIVVTDRHLRDVAAEAERALLASNNPPRVFKRANHLVRLSLSSPFSLVTLDAVALKGELARCADFMAEVKAKDGQALKPTRPPIDLSPDLLSRTDFLDLPVLNIMTSAPTYSSTGDLISSEGYHENSGILLTLGNLSIPELPTPTVALQLLRHLLHDVPFTSPAGFAHVLSALLTLFLRPMINGPTPLFLIEAATRGTGKTMLAQTLALIALGTEVGTMVQPANDSEFEKRVTSSLLGGARMILLDNVHTLRGEALAAALTARTWTGRRLGHSEMVITPNDAVWLATGNNVVLDDDMPRRIIPIRLDAGMERPETRTGFIHPDLRGWITTHRGELVAACLSLIEAWKAAGRPPGSVRLGSYEHWAATLGGVLEVAGVPGFLTDRDHLYADSNPEPDEWGLVLEAVYNVHRTQDVSAKIVLRVMMALGTHVDLWEGRRPQSQLQRVGWALMAHRDRIYRGLKLQTAARDATTKSRLYKVTSVAITPEPPSQPREDSAHTNDGSGVSGVSGVVASPSVHLIDRVEL